MFKSFLGGNQFMAIVTKWWHGNINHARNKIKLRYKLFRVFHSTTAKMDTPVGVLLLE